MALNVHKCMYVITYSPNFAPPHFTAGGIPKKPPHGTMEDHTAYIYTVESRSIIFQGSGENKL
jgi:hypothetical protein